MNPEATNSPEPNLWRTEETPTRINIFDDDSLVQNQRAAWRQREGDVKPITRSNMTGNRRVAPDVTPAKSPREKLAKKWIRMYNKSFFE